MNFEHILTEIKNKTLVITLYRPDKLNALNIKMLSELNTLFDQIENDKNIKSIIITGAGVKAFAAGADIAELRNYDKLKAREFSKYGQELFNKIENFKKPIIAAINGYALGGGFELALACHIRFASDNAKFGLPEINLGVIPGYGGTVRLTSLLNKNLAAELILTGNYLDAQQALNLQLINKVFSFNTLMEESLKFAEIINSKSAIAISSALNSIFSFNKNNLTIAFDTEANEFFKAVNSNDFSEGTLAFLEKRKPNFNDC